MKMKTILSVLGTVLLAGGVVLAQSSANSSGTSKASSKHAQTSGSYNSGSTASDTSSPKAGNSGFDAGLPQSDASSSTSSSQSGTTPSSSSAYSGQSSSMGSQSGSSEEISNGPVAETVSDSSAVIGWSTKDAASSTGLKYGTNRANLSQTAQATDGADGKNHHARLQGLSASTRYYFQVTANGQPVGGVGTFKTTAAGDTPVQSKAVIPQK
jgi:hypothetical protein